MRALRHLLLSATASALALGGLAALPASAAIAEPDRLAVTVVGDGSSTGNVAVPVTIDLVDSFGDRDGSVALPTTTTGSQHALTLGADRDQQGALQQSTDHRYVTLGGFEAPLGTSTNDAAAPTVKRVVGRVGTGGAVDTSTTLADAYSLRHVRGVASTDGETFWTGGHGGDAPTTKGGVLTIARGGSAPTPVVSGSSNLNNVRVPVVHDGQLYVSSDRSGFSGINQVGSGTPTTAATLTLVAAAPSGSTVPHDFAFVGDALYVTYTEGTPRLVKYVKQNGVWTVVGSVSGAVYWGVTGRVADDRTVLYAVKGTQQSNQLTQIVDTGGSSAFTATETVLRTAETGTAFRGVAFAPGFTPGTGPVAVAPAKPTVAFTKRVAGGQGNALSGVVGDATNPVARGEVADPEGEEITASVTSSNTTVVPDGAADITVAADGTFTLEVTPAAVGASTLTVTAETTDGRTGTATLAYRASAALPDPTANTYVGMSDASAAEAAGDGYFFAGDDDSNEIRLFAPDGGEPVRELDVSADIPAIQPGEAFDLEGSTRDGDTLYWVGSIGNTRSGNVRLDRDVVFATTVSGSGADATLTYAGHARGVRQALVDWDHANGHGLGADHYGFTAATQPGVSAEGPRSLNVEGAALAPDGTSMWLGFRSPLVPLPEGGDALIVPLENVADVVDGGTPDFGAPIELDLDGRAIRDLERTQDGRYLIMAGSADDTGRFAVYGWTGDPDDQPVLSANLPSLDGWPGSYESIVDATGLADGTQVRLLQDDGTVQIYGDGTAAEDLPAVELKKFVGQTVELDFDGAFDPVVESTTTLTATSPSAGTVDLTATVAGLDGPEGTVTFTEGDTTVGSGAVQDGRASARLADVTPGTHTYTATFVSSAAGVSGSVSSTVSVDVAAPPIASRLAVSVSPATAGYGQARVVRVWVREGAQPGRGSVTVRHPSFTRVVALDSGGRGWVSVPAGVPVGVQSVTATYAGRQGVARSTASAQLRITRAGALVSVSTPATIRTSTNPSVKAYVRIAGAPANLRPTGRVTVLVDGRVAGAGDLSYGNATVRLRRLTKGTHVVRVVYAGSADVQAAQSPTTRVRVR